MVKNYKQLVLIFTIIMGFFIILYSQFNIFKADTVKFSTTPKPLTAFNVSQKQGEPIFLEFYASW